MNFRLPVTLAVALVLSATACSSAEGQSSVVGEAVSTIPMAATASPATTPAATTAQATTISPATTATISVSPPAASSSTSAVTAPPVNTAMTQISLTVGMDSSPSRVEKVKLGATVQLALLNPTANDSFHLHDYDLEQDVLAGQKGIISFVADKPGRFTLESHSGQHVLLTIEVA